MKPRGQVMVGSGFDGFDKNVAEKMPKIRKEEEPLFSAPEEEPQPFREASPEMTPAEKDPGRKPIFISQSKTGEEEENLDVLKLVEDLHGQLLVSNRMKRALEIDLISSQKKVQQLTQENQTLRLQVNGSKQDLRKFEEIQSELTYLGQENEDAIERIGTLQAEIKALKEAVAKTTQERDQALAQMQGIQARNEENDLLRIKERLKEREVSHFSEENQELRTRLEEALAQNGDLEKKYEALKKSFHEVKESLTLLRDACKSSYYNLSGSTE